MSSEAVISALLEKRLIICSGSGGVGKTTLAAALGLLAARHGLRVLVLTIDPARRLADSLGVGPLGNREVRISPELLAEFGVPTSGELWALMLDSKSTFDGLVARFAPSVDVRDRILANRYYQQISRSMTGSQEYMAVEHLLACHEKGTYDLIVLDTPPSRHALDFLRAPSRLRAVLEEGILSWLLKPSSFLLNRVTKRFNVHSEGGGFLDSLEKLIGLSMLGDLSEFVGLFKDLLGDFKTRAATTQALLQDQKTCFLLITSPNQLALREAEYFQKRLLERGFCFGGFLINRVLPLVVLKDVAQELERLIELSPQAFAALFPPDAPEGLTEAEYHQLQTSLRDLLEVLPNLAEIDRANLELLREGAGAGQFLIALPELPSDVHDLRGLNTLANLLLEPSQWLGSAH